MTLNESFSIIDELKEKIHVIPGSKGAIKTKLDDIFNKNKELEVLRQINTVLLGKNIQLNDIYQDPTILSQFKHAPLTLVEVERLFSVFKNLLTDKRQNFTEEKLKMHLVIHYKKKKIKNINIKF